MRHLVFQLHGPLASWGEPAVGEVRHSAAHPSRSSLLGMLSAALGIRRSEQERLDELAAALGCGVAVLCSGRPFTDFHTAQRPPGDKKAGPFRTRAEELTRDVHRLRTTISRRDYRTDGFWVAAAWERGGARMLDDAHQALQEPRFPLYLGRKACPLDLPLGPQLLDTDTLREALDSYCGSLRARERDERKRFRTGWFRLPDACEAYAWEEHPAPGMEETMITERTDDPLDRRRWHFAARREFMLAQSRE